jgi:5'-deoxy-5'-methylthioadenosine phosphorylase
MSILGVIGGSGLDQFEGMEITHREVMATPYGDPSGPLLMGEFKGQEMVFLPRHGPGHAIPPHLINYRANLWALRESGVTHVIGIAAVGGITERMGPGVVAVPDQVIDYTWGREHTIYERDQVEHVDFTEPYCSGLRTALLDAAAGAEIDAVDGGTYAATQGPRLESSAEVARLERDGCDLVGMTGMPEAGLARELGLCYASCSMVVNWAAGKEEGPITMEEISKNLRQTIRDVKKLLTTISL